MNAETWPRWDRRTAPEDLAGYIVPAAVAPLGAFPGPSGESRRSRVERIWEELASKRIGYVYAPAGSDEAGQLIRQPGEVLDLPGSGTCIDVALVLAAACEHAGLASKVVVVDPARPGGAAHALVAVLTGQAWPQDWSQEWSLPGGAAGDPLPTGALAQVRASWDSGPPLPVAVLDPVAVTVSMGTSRTVGTDGELASAVRSGHDYLASGRWRVSLTVAAGGRPDRYTPVQLPLQAPLRELFRDPATTDTVLRLLRPEYALTPFQARDEVTILDDFARRTASGDRTGIMVVTGVGGAGKTRLALEVADRLRVAGWYAGLLRDDLTDPASVSWLASVRAPLFVVVDYADARIAETTRLLSVLQGRQGPPATVVLTARSTDGDWLQRILDRLTTDTHPSAVEEVLLPPTHPRAGSLYRITADAVRPRVDRAADVGHTLPPLPTQPPGRPWTTLDLVLFGWLAAQGGELPHTRGALYDEVLHHESSYWTRQYERLNRDEADPSLLAQAAAALTLMAPFPHASNDVLRAVPLLADADQWRHGVARAMNACLDNGAGQRVAIRPDPVGDRHLVTTLTATPGLLERLVPAPRSHHGDAEQPVDTSAPTGHDPALVQALVSLTRAAQDSPDQTVTLVLDLLHADPGRWVTVLAAAQQLGGPHEAALIQVVTSGQPALPLAALDAAIPLIARQLTGLGLLVTQRRIDQALDAPPPPADHAALLGQLSHRRSLAGDRAGALTAIDEAVTAYRRLAEANPATFLPNLARSLNNQSNRRADTGDRAGALTAIDEAVTAYRRLAEANPATFLPDLAMSLTNQSNRRANTGDRAGALTAIDEAVTTYRRLAEANPAAFLPDLAGSLNNQSNQRADTGDRAGALTAIDEAVTAYRRLAEANPATFLPDLAMSLTNQSNRRANTGDRAGALTAIDEAVTAYRRLAEANPAAFLPDLAMSLRVWTGLSTPSRASEEIDAAWRSAIGSAAGRLAVGELLALWCEVATEHGWSSLACAAIADAAEPLSEDHPGSPAHFVSRARQTARSAAARLGSDAPGLPEWVVAPIADEHLKVINGWLSAASWGEREAALARDPALVENGSLARTVSVVTVVYPEVDLRELADFLRRADEHGLDEAAAGARGEAQRLDVIGTWIATGAWADSLAVLTDNLDLLTDDETLELLDASDDPTARQHDDAAETAFAAMDHADLDLLTLIMIGCAQLQDEPAGHLWLAILLARQGDIDAATAQAARARSASSDNQRRAWTIHLTRLRAALPAGTIDLAPFDDVAAIIEAPSES